MIFKTEKQMQVFLWQYWLSFRSFPPVGFLCDIELLKREWWVDPSASVGRVDFLAFDQRLCAYVVVELKNHTLNHSAVLQVADYIRPASERLGETVY